MAKSEAKTEWHLFPGRMYYNLCTDIVQTIYDS